MICDARVRFIVAAWISFAIHRVDDRTIIQLQVERKRKEIVQSTLVFLKMSRGKKRYDTSDSIF